jgi:radical SAM family RiPP maturation amino acid epimerase
MYLLHPDDPSVETNDKYISAWKKWKKWLDRKPRFKIGNNVRIECSNDIDQIYYKWRTIQKNRCKSEIGFQSEYMVHGLYMFELSEGCSRGCKFCGVDAQPFKQYFKYNEENKTLWRAILDYISTHFSKVSKTGACYWATEPSDNPDYFRFLSDFKHIIGIEPQTTTAITPQRFSFLDELIRFHQMPKCISRVSVLSERVLHLLLERYSPTDFSNIQLLMYHTEKQKKTIAGRNLFADKNDSTVEGTIACISGFIINMCTQTIELISPCMASVQYPKGYRTHASYTFDGIDSFKSAIEDCCRNKMSVSIRYHDRIKLRGDLKYELMIDGVKIYSPYMDYKFPLGNISPQTLQALETGEYSLERMTELLMDDGVNYFESINLLHSLFTSGIIEISN